MNIYKLILPFLALFFFSNMVAREAHSKDWMLIHEVEAFGQGGPEDSGASLNEDHTGVIGYVGDDVVVEFDLRTGISTRRLSPSSPRSDDRFGRRVSNNGDLLIASDPGRDSVYFYNAANGEEAIEIKARDVAGREIGGQIDIAANAFAFNTHDGNLENYRTHLMDPISGNEVFHIEGGRNAALNDEILAVWNRDESEAIVYDLGGHELYRVIPPHETNFYELHVSEDHLLLETRENRDQAFIYVYDLATGQLATELTPPTGYASETANISGNFAVVAFFRETSRQVFERMATVYDIRSGDVVFEFPGISATSGSGAAGAAVGINDSFAIFAPSNFEGRDEPILIAAYTDAIAGDFDHNSLITSTDIDLLNEVIRDDGSNFFDLTDDLVVDDADRGYWVTEIATTFAGDANLDKKVDFEDFLALSSAFAQPGGWADGDFDGSGDVAFPDFLLLSENFGESGAAAATVPEPNAGLWWVAMSVCAFLRRRCKR